MLAVLSLLLLISSCLGGTAPWDLAEDAEKYLLPGNISPIHYDLYIITNIEKFDENQERSFTFSGAAEITVEALDDNITDIVLHKYELDLVSASITSLAADSPPRTLTIGNYINETDKQSLLVSPPLTKGEQYLIFLTYIGIHTDDLTGFYRSSYQFGSKTRWLVVTDFESFGARRAFPCFDEPVYKATFQLTMDMDQSLAEDGYVAHFNTDVESEVVRGGRHVTKFQKTPLPLSTYLVCILLADFLSSPEPTYFNSSYNGENARKPFRTVGRPSFFDPRRDLVSQVAGPAVLNFMTKKTGVGFGYNKVEQAGIPDFAAGAMENWGLTTYRENLVFWDESSGSTSQKQSVVTVTAHELAHQWFGDLVTLHWWSDLWLNEGFATFFEFHASDEIREPSLDTSDWDLIGDFVVDIVQGGALYADAYSDSRPLTSEAYDQISIDYFFDTISYDKGGAVLRMWRHVLGEDLYYDGLSRYLKSQKENIGTPEVLLSSWDEAVNDSPSGTPFPATVAELFEDWHKLAGYPLVTVQRQGADLIITQEQFLIFSGDALNTWNVPITYSTDLENNFNSTTPVGFALKSSDSTTLTLKNPNASWVVVNNQATGYYRIDYDEENWEALLDVLDDPDSYDQIHEYNRAQIIDDSSVLSRSTNKHYQHYKIFFRLLATLRHDRSLVAWKAASRAMNYMLDQFEPYLGTYSLLKAYFSWVVKPSFDELTLNVRATDSHTQKLLRVVVSNMACKLEMHNCLEASADLFNSRAFHPDMRELLFCEGVRQKKEDWESIVLETLTTDGPERTDMISALACTSDIGQLNDLLSMKTPYGEFNRLDKLDLLASAAKQGPAQARFALEALGNIKTKSTPIKERIIQDISLKLSSDQDAQAMDLFNKHAAAMIRQNKVWLKTKEQEIVQWLKENLDSKIVA